VPEDVVDAGRRATRSASRQIRRQPLMAVQVGFVPGCIAGLWLHRWGGRPRRMVDDEANAKAPSP
jgi:hypothetical protein